MMTAFTVLVGLIALLHVYIFLLETVLFKTRGRKVFGLSKEHAELVAPLMSNQGCYNGFLAAALALGLFHPDPAIAKAFAFFGLGCVAVAGIWGAATAKKSILFIQTLPAVIALAVGWMA
jgi:putative membrane protein